MLAKYVRDEGVVSLEEAIRKMSGKPAEVLGMKDRGLLKEGYAADILLIDPQTVQDKGSYTDPNHLTEGIDYSMVNGTIIIEEGRQIDGRAGQVLRFDRTR